MSDDSRAAIEAAFDEWEATQTETEDLPVETEEEETEETTDEVVEEVTDESAVGESDEEVDAAEADADVEPEQPEVVAENDAVEETESPAETLRAPQSWKPAAREVWAELPEAARAEITRRETEIQRKLTEVDGASTRMKQFEQAIEPFKHTIAIEANGDPIAATRNLMGVATRLRGGSQQEKAMVVRDIIQQYGVDIETLDSALAGAAPTEIVSSAPGAAPPAADPRVDQLWQQQQAQMTLEQQRRLQEAQTFLNDPKNEFANDVRDEMADVLELAGRRGEDLTLKDAYQRAIAMRPDIQQIIAQRSTTTPTESLKRKKRASTSIKGTPSGGGGEKKPVDRRGAIMAAWDATVEQG